MDGPADLALIGGTIYVDDAAERITNGTVIVSDGVITKVVPDSVVPPSDTLSIDCSGLTILPGFWNSHVHFFERKWADSATTPAPELTRQLRDTFARYGFTTVFDIGSALKNTASLRNRIDTGEVLGPAILTTGEGLVPTGGLPPDDILRVMGITPFVAPEISDERNATAAVRALIAAEVDAVKVFASAARGAAVPRELMHAVTYAAHAAGKHVFVHPNSGSDVLLALECGADVIAHTTPHSGAWSNEWIEAARDHDAALTPTLALWKFYSRHDRISLQETILETATRQLAAWAAASRTVLFGTDLGAVNPDPTDEYTLMREAGLGFRQILASLTTAPARRFAPGQKVGRVASGFRADLTVLRHDPAVTDRAFSEVAYTVRSGTVIYTAPRSLQ